MFIPLDILTQTELCSSSLCTVTLHSHTPKWLIEWKISGYARHIKRTHCPAGQDSPEWHQMPPETESPEMHVKVQTLSSTPRPTKSASLEAMPGKLHFTSSMSDLRPLDWKNPSNSFYWGFTEIQFVNSSYRSWNHIPPSFVCTLNIPQKVYFCSWDIFSDLPIPIPYWPCRDVRESH